MISAYISKNEVQYADGTTQLITSSRLIGQTYKSKTPYGTFNPESVTKSGNAIYFFDALHGKIVRAGEQGTEVISDFGMNNYFREWGNKIIANPNNSQVLMAWNIKHEQIVVSLRVGDEQATVSFSEKHNRWKSFYSYDPDWMAFSGLQFLTSKDGALFLHNEGDRSTFYNQFYPATVVAAFRKELPRIKTFLNIRIMSNRAWEVPFISTVERYISNGAFNLPQGTMSRLREDDFENADGSWASSFKKNMLTPGFDTEELALINGDELITDVLIVSMKYNNNDKVLLNNVMVESNDNSYNF